MVWASSCSRACFVLFVLHPVSRSSPITSTMSTASRRRKVLLLIKSFPSQFLGSCRFSAKLLSLACRTSLPARVCSAEPAHGNDATIICVRPVLQSPIPQKNFQKAFGKAQAQHDSNMLIFYHYFDKFSTKIGRRLSLCTGNFPAQQCVRT